jgi:wyosine [tRNA(Phe)-imidazoG37] synthetase (radical SAM superfamily)
MSHYCPAVDGLYLRANGSIVCWNSPGEDVALARLEANRLDQIDVVKDVLNGAAFRRMRRELHAHRDPFHFCQACSWGCPQIDEQWSRVQLDTFELRSVRTFQVEPSFLCNLDCPVCIRFEDRRSGEGPYVLPPEFLRKAVDDLARHDVEVGMVKFSGFGEPQMSPHLPELVAYAKRRLGSYTSVDTNANFEFREALLDCGLDQIMLAMDGASHESYVRYRRRGAFERALRFARSLCEAKRRTGRCATEIVWKTVLFEWNSSDEELREICRLANETGVDQILFVNTTTPGGISYGNRRDRFREIRRLIREELALASDVPVNFTDPECFAGEPKRAHGFLEVVRDQGPALVVGGWVLLDDGPPHEIRMTSPAGGRALAERYRREDLAPAHPTIPDAEGGGFRAFLPWDRFATGERYAVGVVLVRDGEERVRFTLNVSRGALHRAPEPIKLKHRLVVDVA